MFPRELILQKGQGLISRPIAVKSWASLRALALLFRDLGVSASQKKSEDLAVKVAGVVANQAVDGVLPAIFEKGIPGYNSRILPAIEDCAYLLYFVKTRGPGRPWIRCSELRLKSACLMS